MNKRVLLVLCFVFLCLLFVVAQSSDDDKEDVNSLVEKYGSLKPDSDGEAVAKQLNGLSDTKRKEFLDGLGKEAGIDALGDLSSKVKEFDAQGNVKLDNGQTVNLQSLYKYSQDVKGGKTTLSYDFQGKSYSFTGKRVTGVSTQGNLVSFELEDGSSLSLTDGATFDFEKREIVVGEKRLSWSNLNGKVSVTKDSIDLDVITDATGESDLKDFPIVKDSEGAIVSPYKESKAGIELPPNFQKPSSGKFKSFEKDGKTYTVDSNGGVFEVKDTKIRLGETGTISHVSEGMIDLDSGIEEPRKEGERFGQFFTQKDTALFRGKEAPTDRAQSFIWAYEDEQGARSVIVNSVGEGTMYYKQEGPLAGLELNGDVLVRNGDYMIISDSQGNLNIRKIGDGEGELAYPIDKLFSNEKKENWLMVKTYEGDDEKFTGKLAIYTKDNKLSFGGGSIGGIAADLETLKISDPAKYATARIQQIGRTGGADPSTDLHEGVHVLNGELSNQFFQDHPELRSNEGNGVRGHAYTAIYLGNGDYAMVKKTPFDTKEISGYIPSEFKNGRYDLYIVGSQGGYEIASNVFDEYSAYQAATRYRIEKGDELSSMPDYLLSNSQFGIYSTAAGMKLKQEAPDYWSSDAGKQYRALTTTMWGRSLDYANQVESKYGSQYSSRFRSQVEQLKTAPGAESMRSFIKSDLPEVAQKLGL